ncbi:hypothetical protein [Methylocapsa palsarum]|uniref:hypothetical protein n=1 Tax=Methylocapsa palsarum TaxID=1612308 RepID=UPI00111355B5|nr:hypothetical protein [Methylocapsa palsarum]
MNDDKQERREREERDERQIDIEERQLDRVFEQKAASSTLLRAASSAAEGAGAASAGFSAGAGSAAGVSCAGGAPERSSPLSDLVTSLPPAQCRAGESFGQG